MNTQESMSTQEARLYVKQHPDILDDCSGETKYLLSDDYESDFKMFWFRVFPTFFVFIVVILICCSFTTYS